MRFELKEGDEFVIEIDGKTLVVSYIQIVKAHRLGIKFKLIQPAVKETLDD